MPSGPALGRGRAASLAEESFGALDPQTLARAISGDESAWRVLVETYTRRLYALAFSRLRSRDTAEEVVQSVFATVAIKLSSGKYTEQGQFEAWLFRIAINRIRDQIRRAKRSPATDHIESIDRTPAREPPDTPYSREEIAALRTHLDSLSDRDREIIELRHHGQMSFKQIAATLDEPVGTLLARHHRALAKLRTLLTTQASAHAPKETEATQRISQP